MQSSKKIIIELFRKNVKGKKPDISGRNPKHDGKKGYWLEEQFNIRASGDNFADILGFELKDETTSKVTFGDWSANRYIFYDEINGKDYTHLFNGSHRHEKQDSFCRIFGQPNPKKNRHSWSGRPVPKVNLFNDFGQILIIENNLDITARYYFSEDIRSDKQYIVPQELQQDNLVLAQWFGQTSPTSRRKDKSLKSKLEDKFYDRGWFTCKTDEDGYYNEICFGEPFDYNAWIDLVRKGIVFFDSGMYTGNSRPYSQWRANNKFWDSQITERYS